MTIDDVIDVLTKCAAFDQRTVGEADAVAWAEVIGDLGRQDALDAVAAWYAEHRERIMPSDVRGFAAGRRKERLKELPPDDVLMADVDNTDPRWAQIKASRVRALADGEGNPPALPGGAL